MAQFLTPIFLQGSDASANPLSGAKLNIYATGTTTPLSIFSDEALTTPLSNPIVADSAGVFDGAFLSETTFKAVLTTSADVVLYTRDPVYSVGQADDISAENVAYDGTALGFSSTNLQDAITELAGSFVLAVPTTVDNTLPRFNGTSGQFGETDIVVADTTNDMSGVGQITQTATGANKIPVGTTGQRPGSPAAGMVRYNSTLGQVEYYGSSWAAVAPILGTAVASTSGTSIDFTSIPAWVKRITVMFSGVSKSGTSHIIVQIGDGGGVEATGYLGSSGLDNSTDSNFATGFGIYAASAANILHGSMTLTLMNAGAFTWVASGSFGYSDDSGVVSSGGAKSLTAALDRVRVTMVNGSDTFDAGSINILYE